MKSIGVVVMVALLSCLSACHTVQGLGQDIKKGGEALERAATK